MNPEFAAELLKALMLKPWPSPRRFFVTAMVIGLAVSLFQSVTSIQEPTLAFVPKALGIVALLIVLMPWMLRTLIEFTTGMIEQNAANGAVAPMIPEPCQLADGLSAGQRDAGGLPHLFRA
jgi:flagellar biosynthetic protein FliQ